MRAIRARAVESRRKPNVSAIVIAENDESDDPFCRFCFEENNSDNHLISPCNCIGSQKWVHEKCLSEWRSRWRPTDVRHTHCPVCLARFTTPAPRAMNLGQRQLSCLSIMYATSLVAFNANVVLWFILIESSTQNNDFLEWCVPVVTSIGCYNGVVNSVATLHLRRRFHKIEVVIGVYFIMCNVGAFCINQYYFNNYYLVVGACFLSFLFALCFVTHSFYRRLCGWRRCCN